LNSTTRTPIRLAGLFAVTLIAPAVWPTGLSGQIISEGANPPKEVGISFVVEILGLPPDAKKLEFVFVPGFGRVPDFLLGKYELTQGQYESLMHTNPSSFRKGPDYPVEETSWQDAKDFCAKLTAALPKNLRGRYQVRLPTDEEWSVAVGLPPEPEGVPEERSGGVPRVYPWGTEWPPPRDAGNYSNVGGRRGGNDNFEETAPVGSFAPNQFGLYDLGGNVWEWCEDWEDEEMNVRLVRGAGYWSGDRTQVNSSYRGRPPVIKNSGSGFRVLLASIATPAAPSKNVAPLDLPGSDRREKSVTNKVSIELGKESTEAVGGIIHFPDAGGRGNVTTNQVVDGVPCRHLQRPGRYCGSLYFEIGPEFKSKSPMNARVEIEFLAKPDTAFRLQFDGMDGTVHRKYQPVLAKGATVTRLGTGADYGRIATPGVWSVATFHVTNAVFMNSQRDGADFRLEVVPPDIYVRQVTVTREPKTD
jgi:hypothetical protein